MGPKFKYLPSEIKPSLNITWPNAEVMLFDGFSRFGIIKVAIVHFEFQHIKNALENYVKLLDHFSTAELQFLFEVDQDFYAGTVHVYGVANCTFVR